MAKKARKAVIRSAKNRTARPKNAVKKVKLAVKPARQFKKNHAWAVLGLIFSLLGLLLIYFKWYPGLIFSILAIIFAENQKKILHSKMNALGMLLGILGFILYMIYSCGVVC